MMDVKSIPLLNDESDCFVNVAKIIEQSKRMAASDLTLTLKQIADLQNLSPVYLKSILNAHNIQLRALYPKPSTQKTGDSKIESRWGKGLNPGQHLPVPSEEETPRQPRMKIVTINIPDQYLDCIESMVDLGFFPSRSEAVREALKQFIFNEAELNANLDMAAFKQLKKKQMESMLQ